MLKLKVNNEYVILAVTPLQHIDGTKVSNRELKRILNGNVFRIARFSAMNYVFKVKGDLLSRTIKQMKADYYHETSILNKNLVRKEWLDDLFDESIISQ